LAAALAVASTITLSATGARADDQWCGYASGDKSVIECGYSSVAQCQSAVGKGGMCFVDPDYARETSAPKANRALNSRPREIDT